MSREDPQMKIRLPANLKDKIEEASKVGGRSMNAEIVSRLESSFADSIDTNLTIQMLNAEVTRLTDELASTRSKSSSFFTHLGDQAEMQIRMVMEATGLSFEQALVLVIARGTALETQAPLVIVQVAKGTTLQEARELMRVINEDVPDNASVIFEPANVEKTRLLSSESDKKMALKKTKS